MEIFSKAWGNYIALFEFLTNPDGKDGGFNEQKGLVQTYNFASLVPYNLTATNYNNFLLLNAINYVAPGAPYVDTTKHLDNASKLEHVSPLVSSYSRFLDQLDDLIVGALDPSALPDYQVREKKVSAAQTELENYQTYVHDKWADWVAANPNIPREEIPSRRIIWERDNSYSATIDRKRRNIQFANAQLNAWLRTKLPLELHLLLQARTYFDDSGFSIDLPVAANHDKPELKHYWRRFHMQLPIFDFDEFLENDSSVTSSLSTREEHYKKVETHWKANVKHRWGIFSGGASTEKRTLEELSTKSEFSFTVHFDRFEEVEIFRDKWFEPLLFDTVGKNLKEYWGPGGLFAAAPMNQTQVMRRQ